MNNKKRGHILRAYTRDGSILLRAAGLQAHTGGGEAKEFNIFLFPRKS